MSKTTEKLYNESIDIFNAALEGKNLDHFSIEGISYAVQLSLRASKGYFSSVYPVVDKEFLRRVVK